MIKLTIFFFSACVFVNAQNTAVIDFKYSTKTGTKTNVFNSVLKCNSSQFMYQLFNNNNKSEKIKEGEKACLTLYDPNQEIYPGNTPYSSLSSNTPFKGNIELMGKIYQTIYS